MSLSAIKPYLNTRIHLFLQNLLSSEDIQGLVDKPVEALFEVVPALAGYSKNIQQNHVQQHLFNQLLAHFVILLRPLRNTDRAFLLYWLYKHDVNNLKAILRGKLGHQDSKKTTPWLLDLNQFTALPVDDLLHAESIAETLHILEQHSRIFANIAFHSYAAYEKKHQYFSLEMTLERRYYAGVLEHALAVSKSEREALVSLVNQILSGINLIWLLRYRFVYQRSASETYFLLIPCAYQWLLKRPWRELAGLNSISAVLEQLQEPITLKDCEDIVCIEKAMHEKVQKHIKHRIRRSQSPLSRALAYLILYEYQMKNILTLYKGHTLKLSPQSIQDALCCTRDNTP
ncbi:V-type ATPase subunit [Candidatus Venteria ishoeyi]|uniref:V-type ATP synthase subunit C n=1 Tax=Candidatus Venteria ishoeyi TaxID=1899563 RepID=A0A1H6FHW4_9GAMM|nr:V-type ATPase subunit [Candidatus Venteria ishoeyi]MDM8546718.1 V-type ATPase subunit [Candidatus Venteria ishoeyi]SEH08604.1 V-type ATP synthase subunit C [Candidatus Venteria ishoeyi]